MNLPILSPPTSSPGQVLCLALGVLFLDTRGGRVRKAALRPEGEGKAGDGEGGSQRSCYTSRYVPGLVLGDLSVNWGGKY